MFKEHLGYGFRAALAGGLLLAVGGCASGPEPFHAQGPDQNTGYADEQLAANRYRITYSGNAATPRDLVENYLLLRAAQVTLRSGYSDFVFDARDTHANTRYTYMPGPFDGSYYGGFYRHHPMPMGPSDLIANTRYQAYAEIVMLTPEQAKSEPRALNANDVIARLAPKILPPPPPPPSSPPPAG